MQERKFIHIGTSGWHYNHWKGPFYPQGYSPRDFLRYYVERFQTVEINNSFYQLPRVETLKTWRRSVPGEFIFAVKASRYITHMKKLKGCREAISHFLKVISVLGDKLGPILFQLPPRWKCT